MSTRLRLWKSPRHHVAAHTAAGSCWCIRICCTLSSEFNQYQQLDLRLGWVWPTRYFQLLGDTRQRIWHLQLVQHATCSPAGVQVCIPMVSTSSVSDSTCIILGHLLRILSLSSSKWFSATINAHPMPRTHFSRKMWVGIALVLVPS